MYMLRIYTAAENARALTLNPGGAARKSHMKYTYIIIVHRASHTIIQGKERGSYFEIHSIIFNRTSHQHYCVAIPSHIRTMYNMYITLLQHIRVQ